MPARVVPVRASVVLGHSPGLLRPCPGGMSVIDPDGRVTVLDDDLRIRAEHRLDPELTEFVRFAPDSCAWIAHEVLHIGDPEGAAVRRPVAEGAAGAWRADGSALWLATGTGDKVRVELLDPTGAALSVAVLPDPFGGSMLSLRPQPTGMVLWVAAGQDGQQSWLLTETDDGIQADRLPCDDCLPPLFEPGGRWFATAEEVLVRVSWPEGRPLGELSFDDVDPAAGDNGDSHGHDVVLLPGGHAVWSSLNGRLWVVDLDAMAVVGEVTLDGHPVSTVAELYPSLDDPSPCGDLVYAEALPGDRVASVHRGHTLVLSDAADWLPPR